MPCRDKEDSRAWLIITGQHLPFSNAQPVGNRIQKRNDFDLWTFRRTMLGDTAYISQVVLWGFSTYYLQQCFNNGRSHVCRNLYISSKFFSLLEYVSKWLLIILQISEQSFVISSFSSDFNNLVFSFISFAKHYRSCLNTHKCQSFQRTNSLLH